MDKLKVLEWALNLIENYEDAKYKLIEEMSGAIREDQEMLKIECKDLREEIKGLLEIR